jgi:segregation and condensation protein A
MIQSMKNVLPDVKIDQFEGPYDLLVELAKKQKVDISLISLQKLTEPFLLYMKEHSISTEIVASFIVVASTLLLIKARRILPNVAPEEEDEISNLEGRLVIYEQYRKAAEHLGSLWGTSQLLPARFFSEGEQKHVMQFSSLPTISPQALADALKQRIQAIPTPQPQAHLTHRGRTLTEILTLFHTRLKASRRLIFQETIQGASRQEQAVSFLAILEMARNQEVVLEQSEAFGTLVLHKA